MVVEWYFRQDDTTETGGGHRPEQAPINLNGNMDNHLVAASKISNLPINRICGQVARDFMKTKTDMGDSMNNQEAEEF